MSSSEFLQRPEWVDLRQQTPEPRSSAFSEQSEFERVVRSTPVDVTPEEAHRDGMAEGEQRGREQASKELVPVIEELRKVALSIASLRSERLAELEGEIVEIAGDVARRILRGELRQDGDTVLHMARACLQEAAESGTLTLHVATEDLALLRTHLAELATDLASADIALRADASIEPGCVVLETPTRVFDGRPERILDAALRELPAAEETP